MDRCVQPVLSASLSPPHRLYSESGRTLLSFFRPLFLHSLTDKGISLAYQEKSEGMAIK